MAGSQTARKSPAKAPAEPPEPNLKRATDLVMKLMAISGKSGNEAGVADFITRTLIKAGASPASIQSDKVFQKTHLPGNAGNLVFKLAGTRRGPRRLLAAHMDTVPICVGCQPRLKDGIVRSADPSTGLGADDRAGVAVTLTSALEILRNGLPHPPLTFCWFVQEEVGLQGARFLRKSLLGKPRLGFNWDGGSPTKLTVGATGGYRLSIRIDGLASHAGGAPERGISAISIAALAIADLQRNGWHGLVQKGKQSGTSNVGFIQGGEATNVVTDQVTIRAEARSHNPQFRKRIVREIERAFQRAIKEVKNDLGQKGQILFDGRLDYESFVLPADDPSVRMAEAAIRSIDCDPLHAVANGGVDANWLTAHGLPTVTIGCGQSNAHTVKEALDLAHFHTACRIGLRLATATEG